MMMRVQLLIVLVFAPFTNSKSEFTYRYTSHVHFNNDHDATTFSDEIRVACVWKSHETSLWRIGDDSTPVYSHVTGTTEVFFHGKNDANFRRKISLFRQLQKRNDRITNHVIHKRHDETTDADSSLLTPKVTNQWTVQMQLNDDDHVVRHVTGQQNLTIESRLYSRARSTIHMSLELRLTDERQTQTTIHASTIETALEAVTKGKNYIRFEDGDDHVTSRHVQEVPAMIESYRSALAEQKSSIRTAIAFLKLFQRMRSATRQELRDALSQARADGAALTLMDVYAAIRSRDSIETAMEFLASRDDGFERFVQMLTVSIVGSRDDREIERTILGMEVPQKSAEKIAFLLSLGTMMRVVTREHVRDKIVALLARELDTCTECECRVSLLSAFGNSRFLNAKVFEILRRFVTGKSARESIAAIKALKHCSSTSIDDPLVEPLRRLLLRVLYDDTRESTARIVAAEMVLKRFPRETLTFIDRHLPLWNNTELTTLLWKRIGGDGVASNWYRHATQIDGSSSLLDTRMGGTDTLNASYGIGMELMKGKLLKESDFTVRVETAHASLPLVSVGIFARGLQQFANSEAENTIEEGTDEQPMAGMTLKLLEDIETRHFVFFTGTGELMSHVWSGTAAEPITAFHGNLLLTDYDARHTLLNGMHVQHQLHGVLSLELTGEIQVSLWNRNSHSVVDTHATVLFQGGQTLDAETRQFSFGAKTQLLFETDLDFYQTPFRMCMQILHPEVAFRHNTRKIHANGKTRIHRRVHHVPGKSFLISRQNSEQCALLMTKD